MEIQKIDKNFIVEEDFGRNDIVFYPNDLGFMAMTNVMEPVLRHCLEQ